MNRSHFLFVPGILALTFACSSRDQCVLDRDAIRRSVEAVLAMSDPGTAVRDEGELEMALAAAIRESARVDARLRRWPLTERTDIVAWSRASHLASVRARDVRERTAMLEDEWSEALARADAALDEVARHPSSPPSAEMVARARIASMALDLARSFEADGRLPDAIAAAARSIDASEAALRERDRRLARFEDPENLRHWSALVNDTVRDSARYGSSAVVVDKLGRRLYVYQAGQIRMSFDIDLGSGALARKLHQGDGATPEGRYHVREVRGPGATRYHRALLLDYPNEEDWRRFREARQRLQLPDSVRIGGLVEIHGKGGRGRDWTEGCVALSDSDMDRLTEWVRVGTPVTIVGTTP